MDEWSNFVNWTWTGRGPAHSIFKDSLKKKVPIDLNKVIHICSTADLTEYK